MLMRESLRESMIQTLAQTVPKAQRSPLNNSFEGTGHACKKCNRVYKLKSSLRNHQKWECGKAPQFRCDYCSYKAKQKMHMSRHMERMHKDIDYTAVKTEIKTESAIASEWVCIWVWLHRYPEILNISFQVHTFGWLTIFDDTMTPNRVWFYFRILGSRAHTNSRNIFSVFDIKFSLGKIIISRVIQELE